MYMISISCRPSSPIFCAAPTADQRHSAATRILPGAQSFLSTPRRFLNESYLLKSSNQPMTSTIVSSPFAIIDRTEAHSFHHFHAQKRPNTHFTLPFYRHRRSFGKSWKDRRPSGHWGFQSLHGSIHASKISISVGSKSGAKSGSPRVA